MIHLKHLQNPETKSIYLVHGSLDWMFPISFARKTHQLLHAAGADITFREVPELSHTYPRQENKNILNWMKVHFPPIPRH